MRGRIALRWTLAFDTGELRRVRAPQVVEACPSALAPTGLVLAGPAGCAGGIAPFPLECAASRAGSSSSRCKLS